MNEAETLIELIAPALKAAGSLERLQHTPRLALRGTGIANTARRKVAHARVQRVGQRLWRRLPDLFVHVSRHSWHPVAAHYHDQRAVRSDRLVGPFNRHPPALRHPPSPESPP